MLLICHHLRQPREVHHVVLQRAPQVSMCTGSVPQRRREMEHFTLVVRLLVCFHRLLTYVGVAVIAMTVQFFDGGGYLDGLSTQWNLGSNSGVLRSGCVTKKGADQPSDTAIHLSRCHHMFVARVIQRVLLPQVCCSHLYVVAGPEQRTTQSYTLLDGH